MTPPLLVSANEKAPSQDAARRHALPARQAQRPRAVKRGPPASNGFRPRPWSAFAAQGTDAHRLASGDRKCGWSDLARICCSPTRPSRRATRCIGGDSTPAAPPMRTIRAASSASTCRRRPPSAARPACCAARRAAPLETEVVEAGARYGLDFAGGYSAGLFIDQRANRARLRAWKPKRLLNTFAYTCSFSVVAAQAGAETVSVDLSRRSLTRGEENFSRNGLDPKVGHKFIADDVLGVLPRLARRGEKFDAIILDPPTFSRNQSGTAFQVQRDFGQLVTLALEVAAPAARILLSVNHSAMRVADLEWAARTAIQTGRPQRRFIPSSIRCTGRFSAR